MTKIVFIVSLIFFPSFLFANITTLNWLENQSLYIGNVPIPVLSFEGAVHSGDANLPYFTYSERISAHDAKQFSYSASLSNTSYSLISDTILLTTDSIDVDCYLSTARRSHRIEISFCPFKLEDGQIYRLDSFELNVNKSLKPIKRNSVVEPFFCEESVLKSGDWQKVSVTTDGVYKLTYKQLKTMGLTPSKVSIFTSFHSKLSHSISDYKSDLKEIPIYDNGEYILFYGQSHNLWQLNADLSFFDYLPHPYWNENYYFLTSDHGTQKRIAKQSETDLSPTITYTTYTDHASYSPRECNIDNSGDDWYSDPISPGQTFTYDFDFSDVVFTPSTIKFELAAQSVSSSSTISPIIDATELISYSVGTTTLEATSYAANSSSKKYYYIPQGNSITTAFSFKCNESSAKCWLDHMTINLECNLVLRDKPLLFRNISLDHDIASYVLSGATSNSQVWDITDVYDVTQMHSILSNSQLLFNTKVDTANEYVAFNLSSNFSSPILLGKVFNQNLHGISTPDMVIISADDFVSSAEDLADLHRQEGLDVYVTTQDKIFNEFSGGKADVTAIRWFMKMLYDRSASDDKLKYLLLFGDGDVDNRMYKKNSSLVMCYESNESLNRDITFVSDDYFGLLDDDENNAMHLHSKVDIGIGRIPVRSSKEAASIVAKIKKYMHDSRSSSWCNSVCFVADDQNNNLFITPSDAIAEKLRFDHPELGVKKIFLDAFEQKVQANGDRYPESKFLVDKYIGEGVLFWGYDGHASPNALAEEMVMCTGDVNKYNNLSNLPFWIVTACEVCPFDHNDELSLGESVMLNEQGGGIGILTTTRTAYATPSHDLLSNFYDYAFAVNKNKEHWRLGDIVRLAKSATLSSIPRSISNKRKYVLIGDPALRLNYTNPNWSVETDSINGQYVDSDNHVFTDTLQSLSSATFSGYITQSDKTIDNTFNGYVYPTIYDKITTFTTLQNDLDSKKKDFLMWNSILFRGKAEVVNGRFSFSFLLPKDLNYKPGNGRIEYYATSDNVDASGCFESFCIGGYNDDFTPDTIGPELDVFLNSPLFKDGGLVNSSPMLYANVSDVSGINTSGSMVGHEIVLKLDNDPNTIKILNSSYVTKSSDYSQGLVSYRLNDLDDGPHTLSLKLWDVFNNSSTKEISFVVKSNKKAEISRCCCYPNPMSLSSSLPLNFMITNDRPESNLKVLIKVYDSRGTLMYTTSDYSYSETNDLLFSLDLSSERLQPGVYYYQTIIEDGGITSIGNTQAIIIMQ